MGRALSWPARAASGAALLLAGLLAPVAVASTGTITVTGIGDRAVIVHLTVPVTLDSPALDRMGGPPFGRLTNPYFGFAIARTSDDHVVAGRLRSAYIERALGVAADIPLGPGNAVLDPGTYRITLLGRGPQRLVLHTKTLRGAVTWKVTRPVNVRFGAGPLTPASSGLPLLEHRATVALGAHAFLSYGSVYRQGATGVSEVGQCLNSPGAPSCVGGTPEPVGSWSQGFGGNSGGSGVQVQPGDTSPGGYQVLHQAPSSADGTQYGYDVLILA
jgi:hypothetical protein